jgi:hypothetical protein
MSNNKIENLNSFALLQGNNHNVFIFGETHMKSAKNDYTKILSKLPNINSYNMIAETSKVTSKPGMATYLNGVHSKQFTDSKCYKSFIMADEMRHDPVMWKILDVMRALIGINSYKKYVDEIIKYCKKSNIHQDEFYYKVLSFPLQICRIILNSDSETHTCEGIKAIKDVAHLICDMEDIKDDPYLFVAEILKISRSLSQIASTKKIKTSEILNLYKNELSNYAYCIKNEIMIDDKPYQITVPDEFNELLSQLLHNGLQIDTKKYEYLDGVFLDMFFDLPAIIAFYDMSCYENNFIIACGNVHFTTLEQLLNLFGLSTKITHKGEFDTKKFNELLSLINNLNSNIISGGYNIRILDSNFILIIIILATLCVMFYYIYLVNSGNYNYV